ncbi:MAG: hypothetical protein KA419_03570 [Acidobacteria bacterium]|nr:hypothetical protein [Acidobacteriota bacterium]
MRLGKFMIWLWIFIAVPGGDLLAGNSFWNGNGPWGGVITHLAVSPAAPETVFASTSPEGLFRSHDGGHSWAAVDLGDVKPEVTCLAFNPFNPAIVYASVPDAGLLWSTDSGASWSVLADRFANMSIEALVFDPVIPGTLYLGTCSGAMSGIYRSHDGGMTWDLISEGFAELRVTSLVIDPDNPATLYAGTRSNGVLKTLDSGANWVPVNTNLLSMDIKTLVMDRSTTRGSTSLQPVLYAGTASGLFQTSDGGGHWSPAGVGIPFTVIDSLAVPSGSPGIFYAGTRTLGLYRSTDGGDHWVSANNGLRSLSINVIDTTHSARLFAGTDGGLFQSMDEGDNWSSSDAGIPATTILDLAFDPKSPSTVYAATWGEGIFKSVDGGESWAPSSQGLTEFNLASVVADPTNPSFIYTASIQGVFRSNDAGASWNTASTGLPEWALPSCLALDPSSPGTLYVGGFKGVFKSLDGGGQWSAASPDWGVGIVGTILIDPVDPSIVYAVWNGLLPPYDQSRVYRSRDRANTWTSMSAGLPQEGILSLALDPSDHGILYAGTKNALCRWSGDGPWQKVCADFPSDGLLNSLLVDPSRSNVIYAGTDKGMWKSVDGGCRWTVFDRGLNNHSVDVIRMDPANPARLLAGTSGGGVLSLTLIPGDLDGNGCVEAADVMLLNAFLSGSTAFLTEFATQADLNMDGRVDAVDLALQLREVVTI